MSARERELGELPSPNLSLFDRKVGQGLFVFHSRANITRNSFISCSAALVFSK
jgi:hypothetical protein